MKIKRRIEITAFRRQRLATTGAAPEQPAQPSTTTDDESLVAEIAALVKRLTGDSLGSAVEEVSRIGETDRRIGETDQGQVKDQ